MKKTPRPASFLFLILFLIALGAANAPAADNPAIVSIGGGPMGGTFRFIANAIAEYVTRIHPEIEVFCEGSGGSLENVRRIDAGEFDFAIAYAGDIYMGALGQLPRDDTAYTRVRPVGYLYGAPAQLVARVDGGFETCRDLKGKKVAIGNPGSGAALSAERFFRQIGIWDDLRTVNLGYSSASRVFNLGRIDAFWVMVGFPNASVAAAADNRAITLLPVGREAESKGFFRKFAFYTPTTIPAGVYLGVDEACPTFQDNAVLCVNKDVDPELVYTVAKAIWSEGGLSHLRAAHKAAQATSIAEGLHGILVPIASGAARFWEETGVPIPEEIRPTN